MKHAWEVYRHPPVALVVIEVRHTASAAFTPEQEASIKEHIADAFPLSQPLQSPLVVSVGFSGPGGSSMQAIPPRYTNRERTAAVTFNSQVLLLETTQYGEFATLMDLLQLALTARQAVAPLDGLERLGLRYIDEIRVPDTGPIDWSKWVDSSLVGPAQLAAATGLAMQDHQALARFQVSDDHTIALAYGPRHGFAVADKPLVRTLPPAGPFFLLDIDSSWTTPGAIPKFEPSHIMRLCEELHEPVNALFEASITNQLREEVLRNA